LCTRIIVRGEARWSTEPSSSIYIFDEPWFVKVVALMPTFLGVHLVRESIVHSLIDDNSKNWNEVFSNVIVFVVLNTPLFDQVQNDR